MSFTLISFQVVQGIYVQMSVCWLIMFNCQSLGKEILLEIFNCCSKFRLVPGHFGKGMKSFKNYLFFTLGRQGAVRRWGPGQSREPSRQPNLLPSTHGTFLQSTARNKQNNVPGVPWLLLMLRGAHWGRAHTETPKDLQRTEIRCTKTGKDSGSNAVAAGTGFLGERLPISLWHWKTLPCCQQPQPKSRRAGPGHPLAAGKASRCSGAASATTAPRRSPSLAPQRGPRLAPDQRLPLSLISHGFHSSQPAPSRTQKSHLMSPMGKKHMQHFQ